MFRKIADNQDQDSLAAQFRKKRFAFFRSLLSRLKGPVHILDIGGTESYWKIMGLEQSDQVFVTLLNLTREDVTFPNMTSIAGDARRINVKDASFDVVFSNPVIEHVGTYQDQLRMATEGRRVGKRYFIQTPNKYSPLEPHFLFPLFQFLPIKIRALLVQNFKLGWIPKTPDSTKAREIVEGIRLLSKREFINLFPTASIYEEKIIGITKSFVAYGGWE